MSEQTALTVVERVQLALGTSKHETRLVELAKQSSSIVSITNADGYKECNRARIVLKNERINIEKLGKEVGKEARDHATKFSKAVIAEQDRLTGFIVPEENRLGGIETKWEEAIKAEKEAKIRAELERTNTLRGRIASIVSIPVKLSVSLSSDDIRKVIKRTDSLDVSKEEFQEFADQATSAKQETTDTLLLLLNSTIAREEEKERIKVEKIQLEEERHKLLLIREEQYAIEAEAQRKRNEENARIDAERKEQARLLKIEEEKIVAEWARIDSDKKEAEWIKAEKEKAEERVIIEARMEELRIEQEAKRKAEYVIAAQEDGVSLTSIATPVDVTLIDLLSELNESSLEYVESPELHRLATWIEVCASTMPSMKTIAGQAYATMFRDVLDKALFEIKDRHS